ncbi:hypothetical protein K7X08_024524 [Anisodus acutangulus]|uniref:Uncharacterized protein n=1 Tax=Anisodus acutangulus TaxID=402998 RepID=A0A9Q1M8J3_9SOLA|nr:hypothetical protein K7X08_024524 [Anisodus acutangulus]
MGQASVEFSPAKPSARSPFAERSRSEFQATLTQPDSSLNISLRPGCIRGVSYPPSTSALFRGVSDPSSSSSSVSRTFGLEDSSSSNVGDDSVSVVPPDKILVPDFVITNDKSSGVQTENDTCDKASVIIGGQPSGAQTEAGTGLQSCDNGDVLLLHGGQPSGVQTEVGTGQHTTQNLTEKGRTDQPLETLTEASSGILGDQSVGVRTKVGTSLYDAQDSITNSSANADTTVGLQTEAGTQSTLPALKITQDDGFTLVGKNGKAATKSKGPAMPPSKAMYANMAKPGKSKKKSKNKHADTPKGPRPGGLSK